MPVVTKLQAGKRDPSRVNLYLDHQFAFSISADFIISAKLKTGASIAESEIAKLKSLAKEEKLLSKILNYLSFRPRSTKEVEVRLKHYLVDHSHPSPIIQNILDRLTNLGYLDDRAFAIWFVQSRLKHRPRSTRHLTYELSAKGVSHAIINEVLTTQADDHAALLALITKKKDLPKDKLIAYLQRRGFSYSLISAVIDSNAPRQ